ncbi:MAG TPA: hypothetical protein VKG85_00025 [Actinomycetes bacterium]|nr:hypothetical protein [Actinomycetes bacterium]
MAERERNAPTPPENDPLAAELHELGRHLEVPPAPTAAQLAAAVRARLETAGAPTGSPLARPWPQLVFRAAAVVAILFAGLLVVSPQVRAAVADLLRFAGIEIRQGEGPQVPPGGRYVPLPGERVTDLETARELAQFPILVPASLGPPDAVVVADGEPPRVVSLLYYPDSESPPSTPAGREQPVIRIDEFHGSISPVFMKYVDQQAEPIALGRYLAFWIDQPHPVLYVDRGGRVQEERARLSGRTLIVEIDGTTVRIEGDFDKERATEIARSLH